MQAIVRRRWALLSAPAVVAAGFVALQISGAWPAEAATGYVQVSSTSANDSTSPKSLTINCPSGKVAVGALGTTTRPQSVHLTRLWPDNGRAIVAAKETLGTTANWQLTAKAICIDPPAGLEYITATVSTPAQPGGEYIGARAACTGTKELIGFGARVTGGRLFSLMPATREGTTVPGTMWVSTHPFAGTTVDDLVARSMAVCANAGHSAQIIEPPLAGGSSGTVTSTTSCPRGKRVHAAGGWAAESDTAYMSGYSSDLSTTATQTTNNSASGSWTSKVVLLCAVSTR